MLETAISARRPRLAGFTLVELMVVIAIGTILFALAVPSYVNYVRQSRRTEARTAVLDLAGREERYYSTNGAAYTIAAANLGYAGFGNTNPIGGGYYYLAVCSPAVATCNGVTIPNPPAAPSYQVVALPMPGQTQVNDAQCTAFAVDSTGQQFASGTGGTTYCWSN